MDTLGMIIELLILPGLDTDYYIHLSNRLIPNMPTWEVHV